MLSPHPARARGLVALAGRRLSPRGNLTGQAIRWHAQGACRSTFRAPGHFQFLIGIMTDTLASPRLDAVLWRLFAAAAQDGENDAPDRSSRARVAAAGLAGG